MNILDKLESIKNHEITAVDNLDLFCQTIEKNNTKLNVFLETKMDEAHNIAEKIDCIQLLI